LHQYPRPLERSAALDHRKTDAAAYTPTHVERIGKATLWIVGENDPRFDLNQPTRLSRAISYVHVRLPMSA
jgi:hypothetical protein